MAGCIWSTPSTSHSTPKPIRINCRPRGSAARPADRAAGRSRAGAHSRTLTHSMASRKKISRAMIP